MDTEGDSVNMKATPPSPSSSWTGGGASARTPARVLMSKTRDQLTPYEQSEILDFKDVYFVSPITSKAGGSPIGSRPHFDDEKGRYNSVIGDHIAYRYELLARLGKGAFGDVYRVYDHKTGGQFALKVIRNERRFHRQAQVEISVLKLITKEDTDDQFCCAKMVDQLLFREHVCILFELLHHDLYAELKAGKFSGLKPSWVSGICNDVLRCLVLLSQHRVVHADLKPENLMMVSPGEGGRVRVIDFGSSCFAHGKVHTYIQSRYYRSPEIVLGMGYGPQIDMWSLGCILFELDTGRPLFPGKSEAELMLLCAELLGCPPTELLATASRGDEMFPAGLPCVRRDRRGRIRNPGGRTLEDAVKTNDPSFIDFLSRCLTWNPVDRMTPEEALKHPYITGLPVSPQEVAPQGWVASLRAEKGSPIGRLLSAQCISGLGASNGSLNDSGVEEGAHTDTDADACDSDSGVSNTGSPLKVSTTVATARPCGELTPPVNKKMLHRLSIAESTARRLSFCDTASFPPPPLQHHRNVAHV